MWKKFIPMFILFGNLDCQISALQNEEKGEKTMNQYAWTVVGNSPTVIDFTKCRYFDDISEEYPFVKFLIKN